MEVVEVEVVGLVGSATSAALEQPRTARTVAAMPMRRRRDAVEERGIDSTILYGGGRPKTDAVRVVLGDHVPDHRMRKTNGTCCGQLRLSEPGRPPDQSG